MQVGNVVSAVEVVIDVDLPVAMDVVTSAVEVVQFADVKGRDPINQSAKKFLERRRLWIEIHKDKAFPGLDADRD